MQQVFIAPPMPTYTVGTNCKIAIVPPNQTVRVEFKYLRAIQSIFVSDRDTPRDFNTIVNGTYEIKVFVLQNPNDVPNYNDTNGVWLTLSDFFGYIPINQLCPMGAGFVHVFIRNLSATNTLIVSITGES